MTANLRVAHGPLAVEALLLADVIERSRTAARDPAALARTLTIVVPSESLRLHLAARLVEARRGALAGVSVTTLHGVAARVLDRAGAAPARGAAWFAILVRRFARAESALARDLERFEHGFDSVVASVADFFDAGFEPAHAEALLDVLADPQTARASDARALERVRALVRIARAAAHELDGLGAEHRSGALSRATRALAGDGALLADGIYWIRGFADATGRAGDLVEQLARSDDTRIYVDTATIPAGASARARSFGQRFRERLGIEDAGAHGTSVSPRLLRAPGPEAEVRAVAERIRALLDRGARPESIGVVARDLEPLRLAIRRSFTRLAVPFSGLATRGSPGPWERRIEAIFDVLRDPERAPVERWVSASGITGDLPLALRSLGVARLDGLAELDLDQAPFRNGALPLPVRRGSWSDDGERATSLARRSVPRAAIERARESARALKTAIEHWPAKAVASVHCERLRQLLRGAFAWDAGLPEARGLEATCDEIVDGCGSASTLDRSEFVRLVLDTWRERCAPELGGAGSGVQCLSVVEARARTFEHLFVVALNRGTFPRHVREDALLPDALRSSLGALLSDLPLKALGHEEERVLFDELVRSSENVTLSWQTMDEEGRAREPSPFVEAFIAPGAVDAVDHARALYDPAPGDAPSGAGSGPRPAHEMLVLAALAGESARYARLMPLALADVRSRAGYASPTATELARATLSILAELDTPAHVRPGLTPYFGIVGKRDARGDPRERELFVTTLERLADCGWRTFLEKLLRIEPPPDPLDTLPAIDGILVGNLVHRVLNVVANAPGGELAQAAERVPLRLAWPDARALEATTLLLAAELLREDGWTLPGLAHVLANEARPYLAIARELDALDPAIGVCGSEVTGLLRLSPAAQSIGFRADRVDRSTHGLRLVDFKTGKAISEHKTQAKRDEKLTSGIESGVNLQAAAYAFTAAEGSEGRYLFLKPDLASEARVAIVRSDDDERRRVFERTVGTLLDAYEAGAFFPRLLSAKLVDEHDHCQYCEVADACVRGDSGARARLADWVRSDSTGVDPDPARRLWRLGDSKTAAHGGEES
jgi:hypothetical protein